MIEWVWDFVSWWFIGPQWVAGMAMGLLLLGWLTMDDGRKGQRR